MIKLKMALFDIRRRGSGMKYLRIRKKREQIMALLIVCLMLSAQLDTASNVLAAEIQANEGEDYNTEESNVLEEKTDIDMQLAEEEDHTETIGENINGDLKEDNDDDIIEQPIEESEKDLIEDSGEFANDIDETITETEEISTSTQEETELLPSEEMNSSDSYTVEDNAQKELPADIVEATGTEESVLLHDDGDETPDPNATLYSYSEKGDGTIRIDTYLGNIPGSLTIPKTIEGKDVTEIGYSAFSGHSELTGDLIIPAGIISIGGFAFSECKGFTGLTIPSSVTTIPGIL